MLLASNRFVICAQYTNCCTFIMQTTNLASIYL